MQVFKVELLIVDHDGIGEEGIKDVLENTRYPNRCILPDVQYLEAMVNADSTEGRGPMVHVGYFTYRADAEKSVHGRGTMGYGNGDVREKELLVFDSYEEFEDETNEDLRRSALSKLSSAERKALGF